MPAIAVVCIALHVSHNPVPKDSGNESGITEATMVLNKKQEFRFIAKAGQTQRDLTPKTEKCPFPTFQGKTDHQLINPREKQRKK